MHRAGVGLRGLHHGDWLERRPRCGWLEAHAENYFAAGGPLQALLDDLHRDYPLSLHGVGLGLAGNELDRAHLARLKSLIDRHQPELVSEHLCWSAAGGVHFNDLLPIPFTPESLAHVSTRVETLQETLGRTVLIEHLASYVRFDGEQIPEAEFLALLVQRTGCGLLLDLNNLYVNAHNHGLDPHAFLRALPAEAIGEIHLAGHTASVIDGQTVLIDTHGSHIHEDVWQLYRTALRRFGPRPTLIEWDNELPAIEVLLAEAARADAIADAINDDITMAHTAAQPRDAHQPPLLEGIGAGRTHTSTETCAPGRLTEVQQQFAAVLLERLQPTGRAAIYHHNRRANFRKALALEYPLIERIVGAEFFDRLAFDFMATYPSRSGDLHHVGEPFSAFLAAGFAGGDSAYAYLIDLARLEWAWQCALIAADAPILGTDALGEFPQHEWPRLRFHLQPALQVIESRWPVHTLFLEQRRAQPAVVHLAAGAECAAVLRRNGMVEVHRLEPHDAVFWQALAGGQILDEAVTAVLQSTAGTAFDLSAALGRLFALGAVARLSLGVLAA